MPAPAPGLTNLTSLIATMRPTLSPTTYLFATISMEDSSTLFETLNPHPFEMLYREREGWTLIASRTTIEALEPDIVKETAFPCKKITLDVHSSLEAVGFMAAVATRLAQVGTGMGVNPVSGFYHDHL